MKWRAFFESLRPRLVALLFLVAASVLAWLVVGKGIPWLQVRAADVYDRLTAASIASTLVICVSFLWGASKQARRSKDKCCLSVCVPMSAIMSGIITTWLIGLGLGWTKSYGVTLGFAYAVYALYPALDLVAFGAARKKCGSKPGGGLAADVRDSFWRVDFPTLVALAGFTYVALSDDFGASLGSAVAAGATAQEGRHVFVQGGLAFLMMISSLWFAFGFPKYVTFGIWEWYDTATCPSKAAEVSAGGA